MENCEERNAELKKELESCINEWSQADAKITILKSQLSKALNRSEELVMASEEEQKERRKLQDSLDKALRKAEDATAKLQELSKREGLEGIGASVTCDSAFTVEQLNTQVSVLKSRLACPVCHYRDKDCIIMRCRHMFCKHCVEENIQVNIHSLFFWLIWCLNHLTECLCRVWEESEQEMSFLRSKVQRERCR